MNRTTYYRHRSHNRAERRRVDKEFASAQFADSPSWAIRNVHPGVYLPMPLSNCNEQLFQEAVKRRREHVLTQIMYRRRAEQHLADTINWAYPNAPTGSQHKLAEYWYEQHRNRFHVLPLENWT